MNQDFSYEEINFRDYIDILIKSWRAIFLITVFCAAFALLLSLGQKPAYETKTTILIKSNGSSALSQYSNIAGMLGINIASGRGSVDDLVELLKSKLVASIVLKELNLKERIKGWNDPDIKEQDLISAVSGMLKKTKTSGNIIEIRVEAEDPQLAADIANGFVQALSSCWNGLNYTEAKKKLEYIETELPRVEGDLKIAEARLKLVPRLSSFSLSSQNGRVQRDYEIYSSVYIMLRKELESAKLESAKEIPPFSIIDKAVKPTLRSKPNLKLNIAIGAGLGLFFGVFFAFSKEFWQKSNK